MTSEEALELRSGDVIQRCVADEDIFMFVVCSTPVQADDNHVAFKTFIMSPSKGSTSFFVRGSMYGNSVIIYPKYWKIVFKRKTGTCRTMSRVQR